MFGGNVKTSIKALRSSRWRSFLTMFGIIIGVVSVITTVSLGEGVKRQVLNQVNQIGSDLITIRPGNIVTRDHAGNITKVNLSDAYGFGGGSLSDQDLKTIQQTPDVSQTSPVSLLNASAQVGGQEYNSGLVLGTSSGFASLVQQKIAYGVYFNSSEEDRPVVVIGQQVAEQLFKEEVPIGHSLTIRGQEFIVRGVFDAFGNSPLSAGVDLNKAVFIPYNYSKDLGGSNTPIVQILARPSKPAETKDVIKAINSNLTTAHNGQEDVTVLRQDENLMVTSYILNLLTTFIAGIAAISLLVGGIGIMNIMLVAVTERTHEIGIRKAVGATTRQILGQFLVEAILLSLGGGLIGIVVSYAVNFGIRVGTNLSPVITWPVVVEAVGVAVAVGVIFGIAPALKAARKDPIDALRND